MKLRSRVCVKTFPVAQAVPSQCRMRAFSLTLSV
jgi:hypothetical protein